MRLPGVVAKMSAVGTARGIRRGGGSVGIAVQFLGRPIIQACPGSTMVIGDRVVLASRSTVTALGVTRPVVLRTLMEEAKLTIGADTGISGEAICAATSVTVGARCLIGAEVMIFDTPFHPVDRIDRRYAALPADPKWAVTIGDDVFVGARAIILPGTTLGSGSVVGAGSVVSGCIPSGVLVAGNPARIVRTLSSAHAHA